MRKHNFIASDTRVARETGETRQMISKSNRETWKTTGTGGSKVQRK